MRYLGSSFSTALAEYRGYSLDMTIIRKNTKQFTQISLKPFSELRTYDLTDRKQDTLSFTHLIVITIT